MGLAVLRLLTEIEFILSIAKWFGVMFPIKCSDLHNHCQNLSSLIF